MYKESKMLLKLGLSLSNFLDNQSFLVLNNKNV